MKYKQFLFFYVSDLYPNGGLSDVLFTGNTVKQCLDYAKDNNYFIDCYVYDRINDVIIELE